MIDASLALMFWLALLFIVLVFLIGVVRMLCGVDRRPPRPVTQDPATWPMPRMPFPWTAVLLFLGMAALVVIVLY